MSTATLTPTTSTTSTMAEGPPSSPELSPPAAPTRTRRALGALRTGARRSAAVVLFLLLWEYGTQYLLEPTRRVFLPPLHVVLEALWDLVRTGQLQEHLQASLTRSVIGFGLAVVAGVVLGIAVAWYEGLREFLTPLLELFRNTAALALLPVFTLLLGIGELSKVSIVAFAAFFPVLLNTVAGVRTVDPLLVRAARTLGLSNLQLFVRVVLPSAVPTIFTGVRMAGTASILVLIAAEMVGAKAGLGYLIVNAQSSFQIPQMYAGILTVSIFGLVVNTALVRLERHFSGWRTTPHGN
ncbi:ABC transporter permease [Janibacter hoylei]|uniref:ABC transporter permease n=1 Tax=Janibacter hoylei TaxID=364298 RepID=UPI0021A7ED1C|nr:ABC transporter permease [Janibacter hoylei]MCT1619174.1 ABC transporter permease [Janibacter hoylei]MCT2291550.1 ABC transporter permease [Janibacter hoylei]